MSDTTRAFRNGLLAGGLAAVVGVGLCWEYPPAALPLPFIAAGLAVGQGPGYDGRGWLTQARRERLATAFYLASVLCCLGLAAWFVATSPPGD